MVPPSTSTTSGVAVSPPRAAVSSRATPRASYEPTGPPSRKTEAVAAASSTSPPELPRRSSTTPRAPAAAARTWAATPLVNPCTAIRAMPGAG